MDPEGLTVSIEVRRKEAVCFKCGRRRVSRRAVRAVVFGAVAVAVLTVVLYRAIRRGGSVWGVALDVALALIGLLTPVPV